MIESRIGVVDRSKVEALYRRELAAFELAHKRSAALARGASRHMPAGVPMAWMASFYEHPTVYVESGAGAWFTDVDGNRYLDMNLADSSSFCGFAPAPVLEAVDRRLRAGTQFLLADEDSVAVAALLAERFGLPMWQLTLSASQANSEAIRLARAATGREKILVFEGKYHGMLDETLVLASSGRGVPEYAGVAARACEDTIVVAFNDVAAVERALEGREVACVLTEPALTNQGIVRPEAGFHRSLRDACTRTGTMLIVDEAHTFQCGRGGLTRAWELEPDIVTLGKSLGGGVPVGAYGMSAAIADLLAPPSPSAVLTERPTLAEVATGGTSSGSALQAAACRAVLEEVLTDEAYARTARLGERLANGIEAAVRQAGLEWGVARLPTKAAYRPRTESAVGEGDDASSGWFALSAAIRLWFANRGVWEAIRWAGPAVSVAASDEDVDFYLGLFETLVGELTR
jgi:glutamate-1-semialdehyde aminotransferase